MSPPLNPHDAKACCTCNHFFRTGPNYGECRKSPVKLRPISADINYPDFERVGEYFTCHRYEPIP